MSKIVVGKPFLLYHGSGFHSPQPGFTEANWGIFRLERSEGGVDCIRGCG